jgi:hypothetical protein
MERAPVDSSNIVSRGHDPQTNTMHVEFKGGAVYEYDNVAPEEYAAWLSASSAGSYFHSNLKSKSCRRMP